MPPWWGGYGAVGRHVDGVVVLMVALSEGLGMRFSASVARSFVTRAFVEVDS